MDADTRVWEISVIEPGLDGEGGACVFFLIFFFLFKKTFSFDTMINRREVFFFFPSR